jgi:hypothetical protein
MLEAALFRRNRVPGDALLFRLDDVAVKIRDATESFVSTAISFRRDKKRRACAGESAEYPKRRKTRRRPNRRHRRAFANGDNRVWFIVVMIESAKIPRSSLTVLRTAISSERFSRSL